MGVFLCPRPYSFTVFVLLESPADVCLSTTLSHALPKPGRWLHSPAPPLPSPTTLTQPPWDSFHQSVPWDDNGLTPGSHVSLFKST